MEKNKFDKKSLGLILCALFAVVAFIAEHVFLKTGGFISIAGLPIAGTFINRRQLSPDGGGGGGTETEDEKKQREALEKVTKIATDAAIKAFTDKQDEFLKKLMANEDTKKEMKKLAKETVDGIDISKIEVEDSVGRKEALNIILDKMQEHLNKLDIGQRTASSQLTNQVKGILEQMKEQFETKKDALKNIFDTKAGIVKFEIKTPDEFNSKAFTSKVTPITTASFGDRVIIGLREPGVDYPVLPERFVFDLISSMTGGPGSNPLSWVELVYGDGTPGWQPAEGAEKNGVNWTYVEGKVTAEMIAAYTPVSRQALLNWPMLEQEIRFELVRQLFNKLDYAVLYGTGTNEPFGIFHYAVQFGAGALAHTVVNANRGDVLRAAIGQVWKGAVNGAPNIGGFRPTAILVSQDTYTSMDLEKSILNGQYLYPRFMDDSSTTIKGIPVIASNFIGDNDFLVGDFSRYLFNFIENLRIDVGYINDQFIKNLVTVRVELYGMGRVKAHQQPAFVKGDFPTALSELSMST